jgi:hypothetical protein
MSAKAVAALSFVGLLTVSNALASTITNRDDKTYTISIILGTSTKDHVLAPTGTLLKVCERGCVVRIDSNRDEQYQLEGSEIVAIEDGRLFYASPVGDKPAPEPARQFQPGDR